MPATVISNWSTLIDDFSFSADDLYQKVRDTLQNREVPDVAISKVTHKEGGILSAKREYLRVTRGKHNFDICAAPFGTGYFVSWWLTQTRTYVGLLYLLLLAALLGMVTVFTYVSLLGLLYLIDSAIFILLLAPPVIAVVIPITIWLAGYMVSRSESGVDDAIMDIPYIGVIYEKIFRPTTYYRLDTAAMFQASVGHAVQDVIKEITGDAGKIQRISIDPPILKQLAKGHTSNAG